MKDKFHKIVSVFKKYGFLETTKKIYSYMYSNVFIKFNLILMLKTIANKKKYIYELNKIINDEKIDRIIIWRGNFGWNVPLFQRPQHIAKCISDNKTLVFYEVTKMTDNVDAFKKQKENLYLINFKNTFLLRWLFKILINNNKPKYIQFYSTDWTMSLDLIKSYIDKNFKIIYEYIDDLNPSLTGTKELPANIKNKYEYVMCDTENVFIVVTADELKKDVISKRGKEKLVFACNGVDYKFFSTIDKNYKFDKEFQTILLEKKPIVGYYGALAKWIDYDMIKYLAELRPNYNIVLFGVKYDDSFEKSKINKLSNVYFLGAKNYSVLKNYANMFNVCTIPFLINDITKSTSPVKIFEYMALGKPIVTTPMKECMKYKSVMIANNKKEFVDLIDKSIKLDKTNNKKYFELLKKEALENTWDKKASLLLKKVAEYEK